MNKITSVIFLFASVFAIQSCKKEDPDTIRPVIESVSINGSTGAVSVTAGSSLSFSIVLSDNIELKQVKIDIHDAFDGHSHSPNVPFSSSNIYTVSGTQFTATPTVSIPADAASGPYDVVIYCIDASGNEALFVEREISITQSGQPVFNISFPDLSTELNYAPGDTIHFSGMVTDDTDLTEIHILLVNEDTETDVYNQEFVLSGVADQLWDFAELVNQSLEVIVPNSGAGHYHLRIAATDSDNNMTVIEQHVHAN